MDLLRDFANTHAAYRDVLCFFCAETVLQQNGAAAVFNLARDAPVEQHAAKESVAPSAAGEWDNTKNAAATKNAHLSRFCSSQ